MDDKTKRKEITLTVGEIRDLTGVLDEAEKKRGRKFNGDHYVLLQQVLRPSRTATTARLPGDRVFVKIGGEESSHV